MKHHLRSNQTQAADTSQLSVAWWDFNEGERVGQAEQQVGGTVLTSVIREGTFEV